MPPHNSQVFIHAGDLHYADIDEDSTVRFERAFQRVHAAEQRVLFRTTPVMYVWDDHDFGSNNADSTSPSRPAATKTFRKFVPATYGEGDTDGIYQSYEIQGVLFVLTGCLWTCYQCFTCTLLETWEKLMSCHLECHLALSDLSSLNSPAEKSLLGLKQRRWLLSMLSRWQQLSLIHI